VFLTALVSFPSFPDLPCTFQSLYGQKFEYQSLNFQLWLNSFSFVSMKKLIQVMPSFFPYFQLLYFSYAVRYGTAMFSDLEHFPHRSTTETNHVLAWSYQVVERYGGQRSWYLCKGSYVHGIELLNIGHTFFCDQPHSDTVLCHIKRKWCTIVTS